MSTSRTKSVPFSWRRSRTVPPTSGAPFSTKPVRATRSCAAAWTSCCAAHQQTNSLLDSPAAALVATMDEPIPEGPGTVIGPYKLLEQIGEGGFGVVFMAEQQQPVRRKVALKVLKPGMDTHQVVARFEAERQALALMDHPNIAKVFDGGADRLGAALLHHGVGSRRPDHGVLRPQSPPSA